MAMHQTLVTDEPNDDVKYLIGEELFGDGFSRTDGLTRFASYFTFHAREVKELQFSRFQGANQVAELAIKQNRIRPNLHTRSRKVAHAQQLYQLATHSNLVFLLTSPAEQAAPSRQYALYL